MSRERIGKFMEAIETPPGNWWIQGRTDRLGRVEWYPRWRKYIFLPNTGTLYSDDCLTAMAEFLARKTKERKT